MMAAFGSEVGVFGANDENNTHTLHDFHKSISNEAIVAYHGSLDDFDKVSLP